MLFRKKFDPFFTVGEREQITDGFVTRFTKKKASISVSACRDPKDDMFLELALSAKAACIISGDLHLLEFHPSQGIPILNVADFLITF